MSVVEQAQEALAEYKRTKQLPIIPEEENFRYDVWKCVFEKHLNVWEHIALVEQQREASKSLCYLEKSTHLDSTQWKAVCSVTAMLSRTCIRNYGVYQLDACNFTSSKQKNNWIKMFRRLQPKIFKIWMDTCGKHKDFVSELKDDFQRYCKSDMNLFELLENEQ